MDRPAVSYVPYWGSMFRLSNGAFVLWRHRALYLPRLISGVPFTEIIDASFQTFFEFFSLCFLDEFKKTIDVLDSFIVESHAPQQIIVGAKGQRIGENSKREFPRGLEFQNRIVEIFEHHERGDQAVITLLAGPDHQIKIIFIVVLSQLVEIILSKHFPEFLPVTLPRGALTNRWSYLFSLQKVNRDHEIK